jgi:hypothetical protein
MILLIAGCVFLTGCGTGPSQGQIEAALNEAVKAKNPDATAKVTNLKVNSQFYVEFKFSCTNCVFEFKDGERSIAPSSEGHGMVKLDSKLQMWKFDSIYIEAKGVGKVAYQSDHVF